MKKNTQGKESSFEENAKQPPLGTSVATTQNEGGWWAPLWKGLVIDPKGRHYNAMGSAVWLLIYFILSADRKTGTLKRKIETISKGMGASLRTVRRWLITLQRGGYIEANSNGRCLVIAISRWKSFPQGFPHGPYLATQSGHVWPGRMSIYGHSQEPENGLKTAQPSRDSASGAAPYDRTIKKDRLTINDVTAKTSLTSRDVAVAMEICQAFKDEANLALYLSYVRKYDHEIIKKAFEEAIKTPANKIKKTRGALFNYLVQYYAGEQTTPDNHNH